VTTELSDVDETIDQDDGWSILPMDGKGVRIMREMCSTCIFRPGNRMHLAPGRVGSMLASVRATDSYVPCHKWLGTGIPGAICRGSDNAHEGQLARMARRMEMLYEVDEKEAPGG